MLFSSYVDLSELQTHLLPSLLIPSAAEREVSSLFVSPSPPFTTRNVRKRTRQVYLLEYTHPPSMTAGIAALRPTPIPIQAARVVPRKKDPLSSLLAAASTAAEARAQSLQLAARMMGDGADFMLAAAKQQSTIAGALERIIAEAIDTDEPGVNA